ncbi:uncharacterized protein LOC131878942 isoform X2 [Tigriopus californicus]|uniref:uncharacterized protein LOC131878942 isoform X2 n=1 Tax=Tigriopus californicus TaxID=6832 RepID=UPI0027DAB24F|nr:uncharacterized protein LOC131878942 isoform X2 [Tigriopus californicus]
MNPKLVLSLAIVALLPCISAENRCVPIKECESLYHLLQNRLNQELHGLTPRQVMARLRTLICGYSPDDDVKVFCEDAIEEEEEEEEIADGDERPFGAHLDEVAPRSGGVFVTLGEDSQCGGVLKLYHFNDEKTSFKTLKLSGRNYAKLRLLDDRQVYDTAVEGTCCWVVSSRVYYRGERETMRPSWAKLSFQPRAAKKVVCTTVQH